MTLTGMEKKMTKSNNEKKEMKRTKSGNSYWEGTGAYQAEYDQLCDELVPTYGEAKTVNGELLRCAGNLQHEYFNNDNYNAVEYKDDYNYYLDFIRVTIGRDDTYKSDVHVTWDIYNLICDCEEPSFAMNYEWLNGNENMGLYAKLIDMVMHYILTHEDKPLNNI